MPYNNGHGNIVETPTFGSQEGRCPLRRGRARRRTAHGRALGRPRPAPIPVRLLRRLGRPNHTDLVWMRGKIYILRDRKIDRCIDTNIDLDRYRYAGAALPH